MMNFLRSDKPESTMRVNVTLVGIGCFLILCAVAFHIIWFSFKMKTDIYWPQIAILLGGIATLMTGVLWQKTEQKKVEVNQTPNISVGSNPGETDPDLPPKGGPQ